jgi:hypothetical protein
MHPLVSSDPLRLSSCDTFYFIFIFKSPLVVGAIVIKVWRYGGGVSVPRPLGSPYKARGSFIIF